MSGVNWYINLLLNNVDDTCIFLQNNSNVCIIKWKNTWLLLINIRPETERPLLQFFDVVPLDKALLLEMTNAVRS